MMCHNEAHLLPRLFEQIGDRIDAAAIIVHPDYDDDSYEVAIELCKQYDLKHKVLQLEPIVDGDASAHRNQVLDMAREFDQDYVLWLDPDDPLVGTIPDELTLPIYIVAVDAKGTSWCVEHLIAREHPEVHWEGALHEGLTVSGLKGKLLEDCIIERSNGSGGGTERMKNQDLPQLLAMVEKDPEDGRAWYYLAQTYRDLGMRNEAAACYNHRAEMGGFESLIYWCRFQVAELTLDVNDYLIAYNANTKRSEALHRLAATYNAREQYHVALLFAYIGLNTPPTEDAGVVERWVEEYGLLAECAVAQYYLGEKQKAFEAFDYVLNHVEGVWPEHRVVFEMNLANMKKEERKLKREAAKHNGRVTPKKAKSPLVTVS
jgi:tetratricopeptide (TPR) repeat protein